MKEQVRKVKLEADTSKESEAFAQKMLKELLEQIDEERAEWREENDALIKYHYFNITFKFCFHQVLFESKSKLTCIFAV